jgi:hypothetical protein
LFLDAVHDSRYGHMYHALVFDILVQRKEYDRALQLANAEVNARPSAGSHAMLALIYSLVNNKTEAKRLLDEKVVSRSFDPRVLYRAGLTFFHLGEYAKAEEFLKPAAEGGYELGPAIAHEIELLLRKMNKT